LVFMVNVKVLCEECEDADNEIGKLLKSNFKLEKEIEVLRECLSFWVKESEWVNVPSDFQIKRARMLIGRADKIRSEK